MSKYNTIEDAVRGHAADPRASQGTEVGLEFLELEDKGPVKSNYNLAANLYLAALKMLNSKPISLILEANEEAEELMDALRMEGYTFTEIMRNGTRYVFCNKIEQVVKPAPKSIKHEEDWKGMVLELGAIINQSQSDGYIAEADMEYAKSCFEKAKRAIGA